VIPDVTARCPDCAARVTPTVPGQIVYGDSHTDVMLARISGRVMDTRLANEQAKARIAMWLIHPAHDQAATDRQVLLEVHQILLRAPDPESVAPGRTVHARPPPPPAPAARDDTDDVHDDEWEEVLP
jgi:hypothetical protein